MSILTAFNKQTATYWALGAPDGYGGFTYVAPVFIDCRWEDRIEVMTDSQGTQFVSRARIFLGDDLDEEGYLFLGESSATDPQAVTGAYKIRVAAKTPDLFGRVFERKVYL